MSRSWISALLMLLGCSIHDGSFQQIAGRDFDTLAAKQIRDGASRDDVLRALGNPDRTLETNAGSRLEYVSVRQRRATHRVLFFTSTHCQRFIKRLSIELSHAGAVTAHDYRESTEEGCV
jgi:outer membrane protein assembly factor BamE (lipoprotein component of BamABCDE complex)